MKWIKKYSFFLMILITSMIYGTGKVVKAVEEYQNRAPARTEQSPDAEGDRTEAPGKPSEGTPGDNLKETLADSGSQSKGESKGEEPGQTPEVRPGEAGTTDDGTDSGSQPEKKEFRRVELDYLKDALFIGDSRTTILDDYAGWEGTEFFVKNGFMIFGLWEKKDNDGNTLEQMLTEKQYGKIYIMLGINELDVGTPEEYGAEFGSTVSRIRELQPNAIIFVEAIMHVTAAQDAQGNWINNERINARNEELKKLADNETIFYIDANEVLDDPATGTLNPELTGDGVHIQAKQIPLWREFLLDHGI